METVTSCLPEPDQFSSCQDLMRNQFLRICMWLLGLSAFLGNVFVILWRTVFCGAKERSNSVQDILVLNLAIADGLMGVYMLTIAAVDMYYREVYIAHADDWKSSILCQVAGSFSVISCEASVCFLTIISFDRYVCISFPFSNRKLKRKSVKIVALVVWVFVSIVGLVPLFAPRYFGDHFYSRSSVCLSLPLSNDRPPGWFYSVFWSLGANLVCFILILACYIAIYIEAQVSAKIRHVDSKKQNELDMAMRMLFLVGTDFICWMPVIVMGILATCNIVLIPPVVYVWTAVFILPINSSLNPYLYTILTREIKRRSLRSTLRKSNNSAGLTSQSTKGKSKYHGEEENSVSMTKQSTKKTVEFDQSLQKATGGAFHLSNLVTSHILRSRLIPAIDKHLIEPYLLSKIIEQGLRLNAAHLNQIQRDLMKALDSCHSSEGGHGQVDEEHILIEEIGCHVRAFLIASDVKELTKHKLLSNRTASEMEQEQNVAEIQSRDLKSEDLNALDNLLLRLRKSESAVLNTISMHSADV
ncbi:G-protein coupled receptor GRL101-like [Amphiura filiformis]|uniref:G-protein coupled receptor GRL101-like n=1 Tax=Amphiura filiformis TaxID=82378 RepID=UPI003B220AE2